MGQLVVCGVLVRQGKLLAAHRTLDERRCSVEGWEFPGGKVEPGEAPREALARELDEELGVRISTSWYLDTVERDEWGWHLELACFVCPVDESCEPRCREHDELRWLARKELLDVSWLPADRILAERIGVSWDQLFSAEHT